MLGKIDYGVMSITPSLGGSTLQLSSGITQGARHAHRPSIWVRCWLLSTKGVDNGQTLMRRRPAGMCLARLIRGALRVLARHGSYLGEAAVSAEAAAR